MTYIPVQVSVLDSTLKIKEKNKSIHQGGSLNIIPKHWKIALRWTSHSGTATAWLHLKRYKISKTKLQQFSVFVSSFFGSKVLTVWCLFREGIQHTHTPMHYKKCYVRSRIELNFKSIEWVILSLVALSCYYYTNKLPSMSGLLLLLLSSLAVGGVAVKDL